MYTDLFTNVTRRLDKYDASAEGAVFWRVRTLTRKGNG